MGRFRASDLIGVATQRIAEESVVVEAPAIALVEVAAAMGALDTPQRIGSLSDHCRWQRLDARPVPGACCARRELDITGRLVFCVAPFTTARAPWPRSERRQLPRKGLRRKRPRRKRRGAKRKRVDFKCVDGRAVRPRAALSRPLRVSAGSEIARLRLDGAATRKVRYWLCSPATQNRRCCRSHPQAATTARRG